MVCRGGESQKDNVKKEGVCLEWEGSLPRGGGGLPGGGGLARWGEVPPVNREMLLKTLPSLVVSKKLV